MMPIMVDRKKDSGAPTLMLGLSNHPVDLDCRLNAAMPK
jgi:hypothetical protein